MKKELLVTILVAFAFSAFGQDTTKSAKQDPPDDYFPKFEVPVGFSFVNVHPNLDPITSFNIFGGGGQFDVNFGNYWGIKADLMGYTQGSGLRNQLEKNGFEGQVSGNLFTYTFGPQIKKHTGMVQPFGEFLFGAAHTNAYAQAYDEIHGIVGGSRSNNGFAMNLGGGIDLRLTQHFTARPVEVDYMLTRFSFQSYTANQNNFRYFAGVDFTFGGKPPIPPAASCSVQPMEIMAGDPVSASMTTQNFNPKHTVTYSWSSTGGTASGTGTTANLSTTGLAPGNYTVTGTATDAKQKKNNSASCNASFTVKQPRPPQASCSADPTSVQPGGSSTVSVTASSPDGRPVTYSYSATAGTVSGTGNTGTFSSADVSPGTPVTVTANVVDDRGLSTSCTAMVNVLTPPVTVVEEQEVGTCDFSDARKTARVDNVCKAVLDEVALRLQREPNGKLIVVGYAEDEEVAKVSDIDGQRSVNVKYYLTSGESHAQVDPSRVEARTGAHGSKKATLIYLPEGATFNAEGTQIVDESKTMGQSRQAKPTKKRTASPSQ